jgi:predicted RecB family nuclease
MGRSTNNRTKESWVSKTDLIRYLRCPYSFYLLDTGQITFEDTLTEQQAEILHDGVAFQEAIESDVVPTTTPLHQLFKEAHRLVQLPLLRNEEIRIMGRPDGIDTGKGVLVPVEMKSHKHVQTSDELELAFYWLLLEPYRTKKSQPHGVLLLRRDGEPHEVVVELRPSHFQRINQLLLQIRYARENGVQPRVCGCPVCTGLKAEEVRTSTLSRKDLTLIRGIGWSYADCLEEFGIMSYEDLISADSTGIITALRERRYYISMTEVEGWKRHAASYSTGNIVVFGEPVSLQAPFLALDMEYIPETGFIWLIGLSVVQSTGTEHRTYWAETKTQEKANLKNLYDFLSKNTSGPIVTWSGKTADIPFLRKAAQRIKLNGLMSIVESRHIDLLAHFLKTVRIPQPSFTLDVVGDYFGLARLSSISGGLEAQMWYKRYLASRSKAERRKIKDGLIEYNRDDLNALIGLATHLSCLQRTVA